MLDILAWLHNSVVYSTYRDHMISNFHVENKKLIWRMKTYSQAKEHIQSKLSELNPKERSDALKQYLSENDGAHPSLRQLLAFLPFSMTYECFSAV